MAVRVAQVSAEVVESTAAQTRVAQVSLEVIQSLVNFDLYGVGQASSYVSGTGRINSTLHGNGAPSSYVSGTGIVSTLLLGVGAPSAYVSGAGTVSCPQLLHGVGEHGAYASGSGRVTTTGVPSSPGRVIPLWEGADYTQANGRITFTDPPKDGQNMVAFETPPKPVDVHLHDYETRDAWDGDNPVWDLKQHIPGATLRVFQDNGCGQAHIHVTVTFPGDDVRTTFQLRDRLMRNPDITISDVYQQEGVDYTWTTAGLVTFMTPPSSFGTVTVHYAVVGGTQAPEPHRHAWETKSDWFNEKDNSWTLAHNPDHLELTMYRLVPTVLGYVTVLLVFGTDYFLIDNVAYMTPQPDPGEIFEFYYSYCINGGVLDGDTYFGSSGPDQGGFGGFHYGDPDQGYTLTYQGHSWNCPTGECVHPWFGPAAYGEVTTVKVTLRDGTSQSYQFLTATVYMWDANDGHLYKAQNNDTTPTLVPTPTLHGPTFVRTAEIQQNYAWMFDTGGQGALAAGQSLNCYSTLDGGSTWTTHQVLVGSGGGVFGANYNIAGWDFNPGDYNTVYVAVNNSDPFGNFNLNCGIYRTIDGGATWTLLLGGLSMRAVNVSVYGDLILACFAEGGASPTGKMYQSTDAGATWTTVFDSGVVFNFPVAVKLAAVVGLGPVMTTLDGYIYHSLDGGATWVLLQSVPALANGNVQSTNAFGDMNLAQGNESVAPINPIFRSVTNDAYAYNPGIGLWDQLIDIKIRAIDCSVWAHKARRDIQGQTPINLAVAINGGNTARGLYTFDGITWHDSFNFSGHDFRTIGVV